MVEEKLKVETITLALASFTALILYMCIITLALTFGIVAIDLNCKETGQARGLIPERIEAKPAPDEPTPNELELVSLGTFKIYHYCPCGKCTQGLGITATGTIPVEGRTIAVDPSVIPLGSKVIIDGKQYIAEDTGGGIKGQTIDMFVDSHQEALNRGVKSAEVYVEVHFEKI